MEDILCVESLRAVYVMGEELCDFPPDVGYFILEEFEVDDVNVWELVQLREGCLHAFDDCDSEFIGVIGVGVLGQDGFELRAVGLEDDEAEQLDD